MDSAIACVTIGTQQFYGGRSLYDIFYDTPITLETFWAMTLAEIWAASLESLFSLVPLSQILAWDLWEMFDITSEIKNESIHIEHAVEERSTATLSIDDLDAVYSPQPGQEIIIGVVGPGIAGMDEVFGGVVQEVVVERIDPADLSVTLTINAGDYHCIAESKLVASAYTSGYLAGAIAKSILNDYLIEEDIEEGIIQAGETMPALAFNYCDAATAFDKLAELSGYTWFMTRFHGKRRFYFVARSAFAADWDISDGTKILAEGLKCIRGNPQYRNIQYVSGGDTLTDERTEAFRGDGTRKTFVVGYPIVQEPTITVESVAKTVGIKGVETGKDWYWAKGENTIVQDDNATALLSSETGTVVYIGSFKLMVKVQSAAEITNWQLLTGFGAGKVERLWTDASLVDSDTATDTAQMKLAKYATIGKQIEYTTRYYGLAAGCLQTITHPAFELVAAELLIYAINIDFDSYGPICQVQAAIGPIQESWEKFFGGLAKAARQDIEALGESGSVQGLETFAKAWLQTDHPNPFVQIYPSESTFASNLDLPSLDLDDRFKYLVLYTAGAEFFRKIIAIQTASATTIVTTAIVLADEANGIPISHAGLWGGNLCTATAGTGIEMIKAVYVKTKNELESIQFEFTSSKGW